MANRPNAFIETTDVYDVDIIKGLDVNSEEFKEFLVRLRQNINNIALSLNGRDGGYYTLGEFNTGLQYFPASTDPSATYRSVTRTVVNFGVLPNAATKTVTHMINGDTGITANYIFTHIYGAATNPNALTAIPIPYIATIGNIVELDITQFNVSIRTNFNASIYTQCVIVLEYIVN